MEVREERWEEGDAGAVREAEGEGVPPGVRELEGVRVDMASPPPPPGESVGEVEREGVGEVSGDTVPTWG